MCCRNNCDQVANGTRSLVETERRKREGIEENSVEVVNEWSLEKQITIQGSNLKWNRLCKVRETGPLRKG